MKVSLLIFVKCISDGNIYTLELPLDDETFKKYSEQ